MMRAATLIPICLIALFGCGERAQPGGTETERLPVSLNEIMVALVNQSADPIWVAAWHRPETDADWRALERMAYQLQLAGALLVIPGDGPRDLEWTDDPRWATWAGKLEQAGERAVAATTARDLDAITRAGDEIVDVCEGCHIDFKPAEPTGGRFGELSPTAADFEEHPASEQ